MNRLFVSVFFASIALLSAEMGIIRYMSVSNSASFASMIISIALLGYGFSATLITVLKQKLEGKIDFFLFLSAALFSLITGYSFVLAQKVPFVPQSMHQDMDQFLYLGYYYFLFFLPFFFGSFFINLTFLKVKENIGRLYFFNLLGSGIGAGLILILLFFMYPQYAMLPTVIISFIPVILMVPEKNYKNFAYVAGVVLISLVPFVKGLGLEMSQYKDISYAMKAPDAEIIKTSPSPLGFIQIMKSGQFRFAPGLSLSCYDVDTPNQLGIFIDGYSASGMARDLSGKDAEYIKYLPYALPFELRKGGDVLIIGVGGGNPILYAEKLGSEKITAVEPNSPLISLIKNNFADYSKGIWDVKNLTLEVSDGRSYTKKTDKKFDIITIPAMMSSGMSFSSGSGHGENYLFTKEAFSDYMKLLKDGGYLSISMNMQSPPRALMKLEALAFDYLKKSFPADFSRRIIFMRGLDWGMVIVKNGPFSDSEITAIKTLNEKMNADFSYYPGIKESEVNVYNFIDDELFYKMSQAYIAGDEKDFLGKYFFNIIPPTDNKPFFDHNLKVTAVPRMLGIGGGVENIPFSEWGYFVLWGTLIQGILFSLLVIAVPAIVLGKSFVSQKGKTGLILYFSALGMGFMLIEIAVIQKLTLLIANPLYSVAVVISALLVFSSLGANFSSRYKDNFLKGIKIGIAGIILSLLAHFLIFPAVSGAALVLPEAARILIAVLFLAPLGFFMGFPFPMGLQVLGEKNETFLPWALAINGSVSVFASVLTSILSMHLGFNIVFMIAGAFYVLAFFTFPGRRFA